MTDTEFERRYEAIKKKAYYEAYGIVRNSDKATDIVADSVLKALNYIRQGKDDPQNFTNWFLVLVKNTARDDRRLFINSEITNKLSDSFDDDYLATIVIISVKDNYEDCFTDYSKLYKALRHLQDRDKQIIYLRYIKQMRITAISKQLNQTEAAVKSRLYKALQKVKQLIV